MAGTLFVVATPIGNLEDITLRALRILREVSIIAAEDTRRTARLLARHAIRTPTTSLHEHNEASKAPMLVDRLRAGQNVAIVSDAGTPTISDPGGRLVAAATDAGIRVEPIPGPSAILTALAASGMTEDGFSFLGFPPTRSKDRTKWFERVISIGGAIVFFEAPHRIARTLTDLQHAVGDCQVVIARELTKTHEELVKGPISAVLSQGLATRGEFTIVANIGSMTKYDKPDAPSSAALVAEFGELTNNSRLSRRQAVVQLSRRHRMRANAIYQAIELAKKSGERPT
jgi:16S rRNA (cytidine1402-2'-O)-methyltransferase